MQTAHVKAALSVSWIVAVCAFGYLFGATSVVAWVGLAVLSLSAPAVMTRLWSAPDPSMSETIRGALR